MTFEEIACNAGNHAARIGAQAERPVFSTVMMRRRRISTILAWSAAAMAFAIILVVVVWPKPGIPDSPATSPTLAGVPASCPVTVLGDDAFTPANQAPEDPPAVYEDAWYGTPDLWTLVNPAGEVWTDLPIDTDGTLTERTFWWSENYSSDDPGEVTVRAEQLNGDTPPLEASGTAGSGFDPFTTASTHESVTVVGLDLPEHGCWQLTAEYKGTALSYVVWVAEH